MANALFATRDPRISSTSRRRRGPASVRTARATADGGGADPIIEGSPEDALAALAIALVTHGELAT